MRNHKSKLDVFVEFESAQQEHIFEWSRVPFSESHETIIPVHMMQTCIEIRDNYYKLQKIWKKYIDTSMA